MCGSVWKIRQKMRIGRRACIQANPERIEVVAGEGIEPRHEDFQSSALPTELPAAEGTVSIRAHARIASPPRGKFLKRLANGKISGWLGARSHRIRQARGGRDNSRCELSRFCPQVSSPQTFDEVVGQEHITRTLQNAIAQNRLAQGVSFRRPARHRQDLDGAHSREGAELREGSDDHALRRVRRVPRDR